MAVSRPLCQFLLSQPYVLEVSNQVQTEEVEGNDMGGEEATTVDYSHGRGGG